MAAALTVPDHGASSSGGGRAETRALYAINSACSRVCAIRPAAILAMRAALTVLVRGARSAFGVRAAIRVFFAISHAIPLECAIQPAVTQPMRVAPMGLVRGVKLVGGDLGERQPASFVKKCV